MRFYFKNSLLALFVFIGLLSQAQTGLNFQGVARNSNNVILASQPISLRLSIVQGTASGTVEYAETRKVTTNAQGLFNVVIGDTGTISVVGNFSAIDWKLTPKFLKIEMDVAAGSNFVTIGTTQFQSVAYAQFANQVDAEKINGVIPVAKGGTGVASITALKASLALETKVDKVTGKDLSTNDYTTAEKTKLATITGTNTGDQDLSSYATNAAITLKENAANKSTAIDLGASATSDILFPTQKAVKTYVDGQINSGGIADGGILTRHIADGAVTGSKLTSEINGYKKFLDGAGNVTISNTVTTDVDVNIGSLASGGTSNWQSFTAGLSGKLSIVEFQTVNPSSSAPAPIAYVEIYSGQGLSGILLGTSANISISGFGRNWYAFDLNATNIRIASGSVYTARLVVNTTNQNYVYGDNAIYNGGISNISSTWDLNIKTKIKQYSDDPYLTTGVATGLYGGLISNATHTGEVTGATTLTITDGVVGTSKIIDGAVTNVKIANSAVDLTTKVTGLLPTANIADDAITSVKIANSAIDLTTKVTGLLPTANIADAAVTSAKIANSAVDLTTKVTGLLPTANIADAAVTTSKIANSAVNLTTKVTSILPTTNGGTGTITATANTIFATPNGSSGAPSFRTLVGSDIPTNLSGYVQNAPSSVQSASININGSIVAGGVQNTPIGNITPNSGAFTTLTTTSNTIVGGTLSVTGVSTFTAAPILSSTTASKALFTNGNKEIVSNNITGTGNVVMSAAPTLTGTVNLETLTSLSDITVNFKRFGRGAGNLVTNSVFGLDAFISNTFGEGNVAFGTSALRNNTTGSNNISFSTSALRSNTTGSNNFAAGYESLYSNLNGSDNFAQGIYSLTSNINGFSNFAVGNASLKLNTSGTSNIAIGYSSLTNNTIGDNNIAFGESSLTNNTSGSNNIAAGNLSLFSNTTGYSNVALGYRALRSNTTGANNFSVGNNSLYRNTTGANNIAFGESSLASNTIGANNFSVGNNSLYSNTTGISNFAVGESSLSSNTTGFNNFAVGTSSLSSNTTGISNFALGTFSLVNNTNGEHNIGIGSVSLFNLSSGNFNIAIGESAGYDLSAGSNNILIGNEAQATTSTTSNQIVLGNTSISSLRAQVTSITALSDRRDKTDIVTIAEGIDFIKQLKPVTFTWNTRDKAKVGIKSAGFIAQDLLALQKASSIGVNLDLVSEDNPEKLEARYNNLLPVMVKAIQDQQKIIEDQKIRLEALEKIVAELIKK